uniref:Uncharacterized protein n=1 Tax=Clastoptera arizonana TaxID=38151 RepID=A0A1B6E2Q4_9HEMI
MVLILPEHSQRPYRYGMTLLCVGAMFNWLGLADNNAEPVRYIGVTLIAAGALLICLAMCFWMKATHDPQVAMVQAEGDIHHIVTIHQGENIQEKPPDYESVTGCLPPSYDEAIKLNPMHLLLTDSNPIGVVKPGPVTSQLEGQSTSSPMHCDVHRAWDETDKVDDANKITSPSVNTSATSSAPETSSQSDNFGSKVLRLSRKFLGRNRSAPQDIEAERTTMSVTSENPNSSVT